MAIFKRVADVARSNLEALKENLGKGLAWPERFMKAGARAISSARDVMDAIER